MKGPNKTYQLERGRVLLRNAGSADPTKDGWYLDVPGISGRAPVPISRRTALYFLRNRLAPRTLPA